MGTSIEVNQKSLEKVFADLERNLGKKEANKIMGKGSKAAAMVMKKAIIASASSMGISDPSAKIIKIRKIRFKSGVSGHHLFVGRGSKSRGIHIGQNGNISYDLPVVWLEYGTYNRRDQSKHPYTKETMRRHPTAQSKNSYYPADFGIPAKPFIRSAYESSKTNAFKAMIGAVEKELHNLKVST